MKKSCLIGVLAMTMMAAGAGEKGVCDARTVVEGEAPSLLPTGKRFKLVWHDEFNGNQLDTSKWGYRTNFWGQRAHWFATPEDHAVEVKEGKCFLMLKKLPNGQFVSPQLQTGELLWDYPVNPDAKSFWPLLEKRAPPKFEHKYGYYECRCRLQQEPGWWSAFWMQTITQGCCLDPARAGIEHDIMESFVPGEVIPACFHYNGYGKEYKGFKTPRAVKNAPKGSANIQLDKTQYHVFGMLWEPDGYTIYVNGQQRGEKVGSKGDEAVSQVPEFVLITTEAKWYRNNRMTGKGVPELEEAAKKGDAFIVDYVRVFDLVD
ncbi:MAG TPA: glycoside hydrolase family 16 protein [Kiritimatiellia bacterium]|nr:glycoside hydrolase family 16 protein [Kiritimatiellia bacterium]HOM58381.1 glycoside hydrolase family 16 protein [Kiritimatiellia bacterium]HPC49203.1 glycoside hydrolase family 16 protein [Kiritimatiellia bacterium]HPK37629.1 glycoside hydrolase family 16 protein [Kiritimatiellia bacterium]HPW75680.1 glycoside hydrolase family 16 protein [Kiritimatiellia bacterium]